MSGVSVLCCPATPSQKVSTYVGDWEAGMRVGTGTCTYLDGRVYTGRWDKDVWFGQGRLAYGNGTVCGC